VVYRFTYCAEPCANVASTVVTSGTAIEVVQVTILTYFDCPKSPSPILTSDMIIGCSPFWALVELRSGMHHEKKFVAKIRSLTPWVLPSI
jgi:hypothetical protein